MRFEVRVFKIGGTEAIRTWTCSYEQLGAYIKQGAEVAAEEGFPVEVEPVLIRNRFKFYPKTQQTPVIPPVVKGQSPSVIEFLNRGD